MLSTKLFNKRRILWPLAIAAAFLAIFAWSASFQTKEQKVYAGLIANQEIITAFSQDKNAEAVAVKYHLYYQKYVNGALVESNNPNIPVPNFVPVSTLQSDQVIATTWQKDISATLPYRVIVGSKPYLAMPIFTQNSVTGYLVYVATTE
jgi:hypothetical protein